MLGTYHAGERVATHRLLPSCVANSCSTDPAHMPEAFLEHEWDDVRIKRWALERGPDCAAVIHRMFDRAKIKEQAYNPALSVPSLSKKYGRERLEAACAHALPRLASLRYKLLKAILDSGLGRGQNSVKKAPSSEPAPRGHVRGADCYKD